MTGIVSRSTPRSLTVGDSLGENWGKELAERIENGSDKPARGKASYAYQRGYDLGLAANDLTQVSVFDPKNPDSKDFIGGYRAAIFDRVLNRTLTNARANELLRFIKEMDVPQDDRPDVNISASMINEKSEVKLDRTSKDFRTGYHAGRELNLIDHKVAEDENIFSLEYLRGHREGLISRVNDKVITVNKARELMGLHPFLPEETTLAPEDVVATPNHYRNGKIDVANFITDQKLDFPRGAVVKYVVRAGKKDSAKELEDLEKAAAFLQMAYNLARGRNAVEYEADGQTVVMDLFQKTDKPQANNGYGPLIKFGHVGGTIFQLPPGARFMESVGGDYYIQLDTGERLTVGKSASVYGMDHEGKVLLHPTKNNDV